MRTVAPIMAAIFLVLGTSAAFARNHSRSNVVRVVGQRIGNRFIANRIVVLRERRMVRSVVMRRKGAYQVSCSSG